MPADPQPGDRWRVEVADGATARQVRVQDRSPQLVPQGAVQGDAIRVAEVEPPWREVEFKLYSRDVGLVRELPPGGRIDLIRCT